MFVVAHHPPASATTRMYKFPFLFSFCWRVDRKLSSYWRKAQNKGLEKKCRASVNFQTRLGRESRSTKCYKFAQQHEKFNFNEHQVLSIFRKIFQIVPEKNVVLEN